MYWLFENNYKNNLILKENLSITLRRNLNIYKLNRPSSYLRIRKRSFFVNLFFELQNASSDIMSEQTNYPFSPLNLTVSFAIIASSFVGIMITFTGECG